MFKYLAFFVVFMWGQAALAACATPTGNGLVLSFVDAKFLSQTVVGAAEGHLVYDATTKKMKLCDGTNWMTLLTGGGGAGGTTTSGVISAGKGFETAKARLGFYHYSSTSGKDDDRRWLHLKTNLPMISRMTMLEFKGYDFKGVQTINTRIAFYPYVLNDDIINVAKQGTHNTNVYKAADGNTVVAIELYEYYVGFVVNQYGANPQGLYPLQFTARMWSSSNTGAY